MTAMSVPAKDLIRAGREHQGWSYTQMAEKSGVSRSRLIDIERGKAHVTERDEAMVIARLLGLDAGEILSSGINARTRAYLGAQADAFLREFADELVPPPPVYEDAIQRAKPRSARECHLQAEALVEHLFPRSVLKGTSIPVAELAARAPDIETYLQLPLPLQVNMHGRASYPSGWTRVLPGGESFEISLREDVAERVDRGDERARMLLAHELGHLALHHRDLMASTSAAMFKDEWLKPSEALSPGVRIFESPEYQANCFASAFLMPLKACRAFVARKADLDEDCDHQDLARNFAVSASAARIRLKQVLPRLLAPADQED